MCQLENSAIHRFNNLKTLLDLKFEQYNRPDFIKSDPIQIPRSFKKQEDIEIAGFLTAMLAWGQRKTIINKSRQLIGLMEDKPFEFITGYQNDDLERFTGFCHRTINNEDILYFLQALRNIYLNYGGLQKVFERGFLKNHDAGFAIAYFRNIFFNMSNPLRTHKHIPDINKGSAGKRINLFLRWMIRNDSRGVDFGLWRLISPAWLQIPLDLHTGNSARNLGLLKRKQNDWNAVTELTCNLKSFDPDDPVKYDFALFGMDSIDG
jgi:uncharacterized protein (TIGR02757 family)